MGLEALCFRLVIPSVRAYVGLCVRNKAVEFFDRFAVDI